MMAGKNIHWQEGFEVTTDSLIEDSHILGIPLKEQLTKVYYGILGILVLNILFYGGNIKEMHASFKTLVERNKSFLLQHKGEIEGCKSLKTFKVSKYPLPLFIFSSAIWMDIVIMLLKMLYMIKHKLNNVAG